MQIQESQQLFEIHVEEFSEWKHRPHKHNFFELVYIEKGRGLQCINQHEFEYQPGNIFLLPPLDCHSFKIVEHSRFFFIRFNDHYFLDNNQLTNYGNWFNKMAYILANYNKVPGDIISSDHEREFIIQNIKSMQKEYLLRDTYSDAIISGTMSSILNILARSIEQQYVEAADEIENRFGQILRYLNRNISSPDLLTIPTLSEMFGISTTYFSEYFKKHAGMSLGEYIMKSRLKLVEANVLHTDLTLKEIAYNLGFSDSSHLARSFKKAYGMTVNEFKSGGKSFCG